MLKINKCLGFKTVDGGIRYSFLKANFHSQFSGARDFLRLIVNLGMRTYNKKARESDHAIAKKVEVCSIFLRDRQ